jgi:hypothetical protein
MSLLSVGNDFGGHRDAATKRQNWQIPCYWKGVVISTGTDFPLSIM